MKRTWEVARAALPLLIALAAAVTAAKAADVITLKNGMSLEGEHDQVSSIGSDPLKARGAGEVKLKQILMVDNRLTRTYVPTKQVAGLGKPAQVIPEGVELTYIGRPGRASPGEGYSGAHALEQERIVLTALTPGI